jgi:hypothetical protein
MPVAEKQRKTERMADVCAGAPDNRPDTGAMPGPRKGADVGQGGVKNR